MKIILLHTTITAGKKRDIGRLKNKDTDRQREASRQPGRQADRLTY
jgi:hypothetical protein